MWTKEIWLHSPYIAGVINSTADVKAKNYQSSGESLRVSRADGGRGEREPFSQVRIHHGLVHSNSGDCLVVERQEFTGQWSGIHTRH